MVWNMIYDLNAPAGTLSPISHEELWRRLQRFLEDVVPVAEQSGVRMAAHPDDPPMPTMRGQPRLVYQPHMYQRLIDLAPSPNNALELCVGTLAEMTEGDVYEAGKLDLCPERLGSAAQVPSYHRCKCFSSRWPAVRLRQHRHQRCNPLFSSVFPARCRGRRLGSGMRADRMYHRRIRRRYSR